nr:1-aminocyclopropane-1-carboxylate synthase 3-like [Tanacetum cinerariifolium]
MSWVLPSSISEFVQDWSEGMPVNFRKIWKLIGPYAIWQIWLARNQATFNDKFFCWSKALRWPPKITLGRLLSHTIGLGFKPRRGGFPSGAKKEWGLSPKAKVRVLHTAQLDVTALARFMSEIRGNTITFDPNNLVLTAGATSANETLMFCVANPSDAFLVPAPYYPGFDRDLKWRTGAEIVPIQCSSSNSFKITKAASLVMKSTRGLFLVQQISLVSWKF